MTPVFELIDFSLEPYEIKEFQTAWDMMNDNGTIWPTSDDFLVSTGIYNVIGEVALFPEEQRLPVSVSVNIVPELSTLFLLALAGLFLKKRRK